MVTLKDKYDTLQRNLCYTSSPDEYQTYYRDVMQMFVIWRWMEFSNELPLCPIYATDDTERLSDDGQTLGICERYTDGTFVIRIDTVACAMRAFVTRQSLYRVTAEVVLHEMCHGWCAVNGIKDADENGIHNEAFRDAARRFGLTCRKGAQGYNKTSVRRGHWQPFLEYARNMKSYSPWLGFHGEYSVWMPTLADRMRTSHVTEDVAWSLFWAA